MKKENENMWTQQRKKNKNWLIASGLEPLSPTWGCFFGCSVRHIVKQIKTVCHAASTSNRYFRYVCWFYHSGKTQESSFAVFQEKETFLAKKFL